MAASNWQKKIKPEDVMPQVPKFTDAEIMQFSVESMRQQFDSTPRDDGERFAVDQVEYMKASLAAEYGTEDRTPPNDAMCVAISRHAFEDTYFQHLGIDFKLGDFGLAHYSSEMPNGMVGTELFLSPQAMNGGAGAYAKADEFALGATIFALLCESYPIKNHMKDQILQGKTVIKTSYRLTWKNGSLDAALSACNQHRVKNYGKSYALTPGAVRVMRLLLSESDVGSATHAKRRSVANVLKDQWFASYTGNFDDAPAVAACSGSAGPSSSGAGSSTDEYGLAHV